LTRTVNYTRKVYIALAPRTASGRLLAVASDSDAECVVTKLLGPARLRATDLSESRAAVVRGSALGSRYQSEDFISSHLTLLTVN
jgi:hypothetical protein